MDAYCIVAAQEWFALMEHQGSYKYQCRIYLCKGERFLLVLSVPRNPIS